MPEISREAFSEFLAETVLEDICLWEASIVRPNQQHEGERTYRFGEHAELVDADEHRAIIHATYGVAQMAGDLEAVVLEVTMRAVYQTPEQMSAEIFEQFRKLTLRLHTVPFAREWFRDASGRMGIGSILLPLALAHPAAMPRRKGKTVKKEGRKKMVKETRKNAE